MGPGGMLLLALLLGGLLLDEVVEPVQLAERLRWFLSQPWAPVAALLGLVTLWIGAVWLLFAITVRAIATYRPRPDKR